METDRSQMKILRRRAETQSSSATLCFVTPYSSKDVPGWVHLYEVGPGTVVLEIYSASQETERNGRTILGATFATWRDGDAFLFRNPGQGELEFHFSLAKA